jgi:hypothetical protein
MATTAAGALVQGETAAAEGGIAERTDGSVAFRVGVRRRLGSRQDVRPAGTGWAGLGWTTLGVGEATWAAPKNSGPRHGLCATS